MDKPAACVYQSVEKDLTLVVEDEYGRTTIPANRQILAKSSTFFTAMLKGDYAEAQQSEIIIYDVCPNAFRLLVHFCHGCYESCFHAFTHFHNRYRNQDQGSSIVWGTLPQKPKSDRKKKTSEIENEFIISNQSISLSLSLNNKTEKSYSNFDKTEITVKGKSKKSENDVLSLQDMVNLIALCDRFILPDFAKFLCCVISSTICDTNYSSLVDLLKMSVFHGMGYLTVDCVRTLFLSSLSVDKVCDSLVELMQNIHFSEELQGSISSLFKKEVLEER